MKDERDLQALSRLLEHCAPDADARSVANAVGAETMECFLLLEAFDFVKLCGFKIVQARKFAASIREFASKRLMHSSNQPSASQSPSNKIYPTVAAISMAVQEDNSTQVVEKVDEVDSISVPPDGDDSDADFDIRAAIADEGTISDGSGGLRPFQKVLRRKDSRHGKKRTAQALFNRSNGSKRMCLVDPVARGAQSTGNGRPVKLSRGIAGKSCLCAVELDAIVPQFLTAVRTEAERKSRAKYSGNPLETVGKYNLSRLAPIATSLFFDPAGNFVYHGVCICKKFGLGKNWLSSTHRRAVSLSKVPVIKVKKQNLSKVDDELLQRIVLPEGVCMSRKEYLISRESQDSISLVRDRSNLHGLSGTSSNRTAKHAREFVVAFTRQNCSPNGRTRDSHGRFHGAPNYLDAKFLLYSKERQGEQRLAFTDECVSSMAKVEPFLSNPRLLIKPRTVRAILSELFGKVKFVDGLPVYNEEYTVLYPQKTDACSDCVRISQQMASDRQSLKRHESQSDCGIDRMMAIKDVKTSLADHEIALKRHTEEAGRASKFHKDCVATAFTSYASVAAHWESLMTKGSPVNDAELNQFCEESSSLWLDVSTDYQQDKAVPSWKESAQPGPTYYLSGVTNYIHIIVIESCGMSTGPTRFSRNLVYIRDERFAGSKTSDDTLSTIADALLSRSSPSAKQPSKFRSGYNAGGKID
eukprot:IDg4486t1